MKKTTKRILALALTLCTVFGLMVPTAFAAGSTTYDFTSTGNEMGVTWDIIRNATGRSYLYNGSIGSSGNTDVAVNSSGIQVEFNKAYDTCQPVDNSTYMAQTGRWLAVEIKDVPAGTYDASFGLTPIGNGGYANLFIVDSKTYYEQDKVYCTAATSATEPIKLTYDQTTEMFGKMSFIKETRYDSCKTNLGSSKTTQSVGSITFAESGDYVLIFQCNGVSGGSGVQLSVSSLTLTSAVATVGDEAYTDAVSAETAIAAADANTAVKITGDLKLSSALITSAAITVNEGAVLDLNGSNLTAKSVTVLNGGSVIDTGATAGLLTGTLSASGSNGGYLPLKNSAGAYSFYEAEVNVDSAADGKLKFQVKFDKNAGYDAMSVENTGAEIGGAFAWTVGGEAKTQSHDISYADGVTLAQKWGQMVKEKSYANGWIVLTFTGLDGFEKLSVAPYVTSAGVTIRATAQELK